MTHSADVNLPSEAKPVSVLTFDGPRGAVKCVAVADFDAMQSRAVDLSRQLDEARALADRLRLEAQGHAMEARGKAATTTGGAGELGNLLNDPVEAEPIGYMRPEDVPKSGTRSSFWVSFDKGAYYREPLYTAASLTSARADGIREASKAANEVHEYYAGVRDRTPAGTADHDVAKECVIASARTWRAVAALLPDQPASIRALINKDAGGE